VKRKMSKTKYRYREIKKLMEFTCPKCGATIQQSNDTGKVIKIISSGEILPKKD